MDQLSAVGGRRSAALELELEASITSSSWSATESGGVIVPE